MADPASAPPALQPLDSTSVWPFLIVSALLVGGAAALDVEAIGYLADRVAAWQATAFVNKAAFVLWAVVSVVAGALSVWLMVARPPGMGARWLMAALAGCAFYAAETLDGRSVRQWEWPRHLAARLAPEGADSLVGVLVGRVSLWFFAVGVVAPIFALLMFSIRFPRPIGREALRRAVLPRLLAAALAWRGQAVRTPPLDADDTAASVARFSGVLLLAWLSTATALPPLIGGAASIVVLAAAFVMLRGGAPRSIGVEWSCLGAAGAIMSAAWAAHAGLGPDSAVTTTARSLAVFAVAGAFAIPLRRLLAWRPWWPLAIGAVVAPLMVADAGLAPTGPLGGEAALRLMAPWVFACLGAATVNLVQTFFEGDDDARRRVGIVLVSLAAALGLLAVFATARFYESTSCPVPGEGAACIAAQRVWVFSQSLMVLVVLVGAAIAVLARGDVDPTLRWTRATMLALSGVFLFVVFVVVEHAIETTLGARLPSWSPGVLASLTAASLVHVLKHPFDQALERVSHAGQGDVLSDGGEAVSPRDRTMARVAFAMVALIGVLYARELAAGRGTEEPLSEVIARSRRSVYLLVLKQGQSERALATAWAYSPGTLATNAHVAEEVQKALNGRGDTTVVARRTHGRFDDVQVTGVLLHPGYPAYGRTWFRLTPSRRDTDGRLEPIEYAPAYDVALLTVAEGATLDPPLPIADAGTLGALAPQTPLVYVGFPSEGLLEQNLHQPAPVSQQGFLSAFETATRTRVNDPRDATVLVHSIPATGGASGSPILDTRGRVVGLISAVNTIVQGTGARAPNAVQLNYGQMSDLLAGVTTTTAGDVAALRERWARELAAAFVVLPDAGEEFLASAVRDTLSLGRSAAIRDLRIFSKDVDIPPRRQDGSGEGGRTAVLLDVTGQGPFAVTALDTSRDVDLDVEWQTARGWTRIGKDELVSGVASVLVPAGVTGTIRVTLADADNRPREEAPSRPVRLDVYRKPSTRRRRAGPGTRSRGHAGPPGPRREPLTRAS